jgi:hypothetical protein
MHTHTSKYLKTGFFSLFLAMATAMFGQGVTTSGINGFVTDKNGTPIVGATVTAVNSDTGSKYTAVTRGGGTYDLVGLSSGGSYTVTASASGFTAESQKGLSLTGGGTSSENFSLNTEVVQMEAVSVQASRDPTFDPSAMDMSLNLNAAQIAQTATIRRDVQDYQNLDPRVTVMQTSNGDSEYEVSAQGQNSRENAFLIDGVTASDSFGLDSNGYAGERSPLAPEWIQSITQDVNPYDPAYSGFLGELLDVTLKSGTNDFHGGAYEIYTGTGMRGRDPVFNPLTGTREPMQQHTTGVYVGGPIIKDKLFFFLGYDAYREIAISAAQEYNPQDNATDAALVNTIYTTAVSKYGYQPGALSGPAHTWEQNAVGKIDWNISDSQKFEFTYRHTDGEAPNYVNYTFTNETAFADENYTSHRVDSSYVAKLNSDWSAIVPNFHTELEGMFHRFNGTAVPGGLPITPEVIVDGLGGTNLTNNTAVSNGTLVLGTNNSYQLNALYIKEDEAHLFGEYSIGNHTLKFGPQFDRNEYYDLFVQNYTGTFSFTNVTDFINGTPTGVTLAAVDTAEGYTNYAQSIDTYEVTDYSGMLQDTWHASENLTIAGGARIDDPYTDNKPPFSPLFYNTYGYRNNTTLDGNYVISPRLGFNYSLPGSMKTQVRGGIGLFVGPPPGVWVGDSYGTAGQLTSYSISNGAAPIAGYTFTGNPATQLVPPVAAAVPVPTFNVTSPNFHDPSTWKGNIAIDRQLPWLDTTFTAEVDATKVNQDVFYQSLNIKLAQSGPAYTPDGAIRYAGNITPTNTMGIINPVTGATFVSTISATSAALLANAATGPVYELTNTPHGSTQEYILELQRPMKDHWSYSLSWSHNHDTTVEAGTSSVAQSNYTGQAFLNPNSGRAYISDYEVPNKIVATLAREYLFFGRADAKTTIAAQWIQETGHPYSFIFYGDADGSGIANRSLFYVPSGPADPKVLWASATEETNFFQFLANTPDLAKWAGQVVPRNSAFAPWEKTLNLHVEQEIPVEDTGIKLTVFADCFNFANLLDRDWGISEVFDFPYTRTIAGTAYNPAGNGGAGQYIYTFNSATLGGETIYSDMSRWNVQIGIKLEF